MRNNNIVSTKQHGFVPSRNCMSNLLVCMELWSDLQDGGIPIDIVYTDFAKAFDRVPHQRLLKKMKDIGIIGNTNNWITAFLSERKQRVRIENQCSSWTPVKSGVPQGSVLGPTLFVIFINDLPEVVESMCHLFADDAKVFSSVSSSEDNTRIQGDVDKLTEWARKWQLPFNVDKCKSLHIGKNNRKYIYAMNGRELEQVNEEKDLGILIDNELKFHKHTAAVIKKANSILGMIKNVICLARYNNDPSSFQIFSSTPP